MVSDRMPATNPLKTGPSFVPLFPLAAACALALASNSCPAVIVTGYVVMSDELTVTETLAVDSVRPVAVMNSLSSDDLMFASVKT